MPLYEYECESCGNRFEVIQRFSDQPLTSCQHCGGTLRKLLSAPAIQFKGSGWYVTDYARKGRSGGDDSAPSKGHAAPADKAAGASSGGAKAESASSGSPAPGPAGGGSSTPASPANGSGTGKA